METTELQIERILVESQVRANRLSTGFDPISGEGSVGERYHTHQPGRPDIKVWLPVSMLSLTLTPENYEEMRILHDFPYWAAKYVYIKRKGGGDDVPFVLNHPQRKFVEALEADRCANRPIRLILLKARQWGGSTCSQIYMGWLQLIHSTGLNSLIIAHQGVASDEIKDMFDRMIHAYPDEMLLTPDATDDSGSKKGKAKKMERVGRSGGIYRIPARNCKIKIGTAERPNSCRGGDYNLVHCSEVGIWRKTDGKSPEDILRSACSGILLTPMTMIVYESTANGTGNFFHREYEAAKRGVSQFAPLFISWFEIEQYSLPFRNEEERRRFAMRLYEGRESQSTPSEREQPGAYLWWLWTIGASLEAINWYVSERSKYSDHGLMAAEYPSDDIEAFVHSGARVFDKYKVEELRHACCNPMLTGEIDDKGFTPLHSGGWQIWEEPGRHIFSDRYVAVVDVGGRSAKADWSVIAIFDREPMKTDGRPAIVAQWRGHCDFDILTRKAMHAARHYGNALLVIESNTLETRDPDRNTDGDHSSFILTRLRNEYSNLYARQPSPEAIAQGLPARYGFHTNISTKPMIIDTLTEIIRDGLYTERDQRCLDEYLTYEKRQNGSYGAIAGAHDDLLMTRAIGLHIIFHEMTAPRHTPADPTQLTCAAAYSRPARRASPLARW